MVEKLIIEDDQFRLFLILRLNNDEWINFRVRSARKNGVQFKRSRLAYNRVQRRLSETHSTKSFRDKNPEGLLRVQSLIERAIGEGLV